MNGNNILIYKDGTLIGAVKGHDISTDSDTIEVSTPSSGQWKTYIKGRKSWEVSVNYLVTAASDLGALLNVGGTYTLKIQARDSQTYVSGSAILTSCKITASRSNLVKGSFTFRGTGALA